MTELFERKIRDGLLKGQSSVELGQTFLTQSFEGRIPIREMDSLFGFLFEANLWPQFLQMTQALAEDLQPLSYPLLIEIFGQLNAQPSSLFWNTLFEGAHIQNRTETLARSEQFPDSPSRLKEIRNNFRKSLEESQLKQKDLLFEKLRFFIAQRMIDEEKRAIDLIQRIYPDEPELWKIRASFKERWAESVLARHQDPFGKQVKKRIPFTTEEKKYLDFILLDFKKILRGCPARSVDIAIFFLMIEDYEHALETLENSPASESSDWLRLELHLLSRQFVSALEEARLLEIKYSERPETSFATTYARAQALYGLNQEPQAIEMLQSLVKIRPGYRAAHSLLHEWAGDLSPI